MARRSGRKAKGDMNSFWFRTWTESGYSLRDLGKKFGVTNSTVRCWFVGKFRPAKEKAIMVCDFFDVDPEKGIAEFENAYKRYHHLSTLSDLSEIQFEASAPVESSANTDGQHVYAVAEDNIQKYDEVLELLYKKVDFHTYMKVVEVLRG